MEEKESLLDWLAREGGADRALDECSCLGVREDAGEEAFPEGGDRKVWLVGDLGGAGEEVARGVGAEATCPQIHRPVPAVEGPSVRVEEAGGAPTVEFDALHGREIHGALDEGRVLGGKSELQERGALGRVLRGKAIGLGAEGASGVEDPQADDIRVLCPAVSLPGEPSAALGHIQEVGAVAVEGALGEAGLGGAVEGGGRGSGDAEGGRGRGRLPRCACSC
jgi:hypothetical protein